MAIPSQLLAMQESLRRCVTIFDTVIEYDKSLITSDDQTKTYSLTWRNFKPTKFKNDYLAEFNYVKDEQQYSLRLRDPETDEISFIQFIYHFSENGELLEDSQILYFPPIRFRSYTTEELFDFSQDEETASFLLDLEDSSDIKFGIENSSHIRIDYSKKHYHPIIHPLVHLHFGAINNMRVAFTKFPSPFMFASLIIQNFFKKEWINIFISDDGKFLHQKYSDEIKRAPLIIPDSYEEQSCFFMHHK